MDAAAVAAATNTDVTSLRSVGQGDRVWIASGARVSFVLRRTSLAGLAWRHAMLRTIAEEAPVPRPLRLFDGGSFRRDGDAAWECLELLPGTEIGWNPSPSLREVGAFLAEFHAATARSNVEATERPGGFPLGQLLHLVDWAGAAISMGSPEAVEELRSLLDEFDEQLRVLVHGDPTTFNILADGRPRRPTGLVDFDLADLEPAVADLAFCLWRSGRPSQGATFLDLGRVRDLVDGYRTVRSLSDDELDVLVLCLRGRGLQMLVKRARHRLPDRRPLAELRWITEHRGDVRSRLA